MASTSERVGSVTHEVINQSQALGDFNAFAADTALREALVREGGDWGLDPACATSARSSARRKRRSTPAAS